MIHPVASARYVVADIKTLQVLDEFCIDFLEITWKYDDFYADFDGIILKEKKSVKKKL